MLDLLIKRFAYYKELGDKTLAQLSEENLLWQPNEESNSVAVIVQHLSGNMRSRWTNFLTEDGEKSLRNRDAEFVPILKTKDEVFCAWEQGWHCLFTALDQVTDSNLHSTIYIRGEPHSVLDAILRQLAHYPYHVGQMVYIAKILKDTEWQTLSIARNQSEQFNAAMQMAQNPEHGPENASPVCFANSPEVRDDFRT